MNSPASFPLVAAAVALAMCTTTPAFAQATPRAPQGVFGALRSEEAKTKLDVTTSLIEGYDDDVPTDVSQAIDPAGLQPGGFMTILNASANFSWSGKWSDVTGTVATDFRHYATTDQSRSQGNSAGVGASFRLPARTSLQFNEAFAYSPTYMYGLFPTGAPQIDLGSTPPSSPDYKMTTLESFAYTTLVGVTHQFTTRSRLSANGDYTFSDRLHETPQWRDVTSHAFHVDYLQNISQNTALTSQYRYRKGAFGNAGEGETTENGVDVGTTFSKPLSATRRVNLDVKAGFSRAEVPVLALGAGAIVPERQFLGSGEVRFGYDFGRTWSASANYRRGIEYVIDLPQPVFADSVGASVAGTLDRRLDIAVFAGYSSGTSLLNRNSLLFNTYASNVRVRYALKRTLATYVEYLYYYYSNFRGNAQLAEGVPPGVERNGVRAGLSLWLSALRR